MMKYFSNRQRGKNTRKIYRQNVAKYNCKYLRGYRKYIALNGRYYKLDGITYFSNDVDNDHYRGWVPQIFYEYQK